MKRKKKQQNPAIVIVLAAVLLVLTVLLFLLMRAVLSGREIGTASCKRPAEAGEISIMTPAPIRIVDRLA